MIELGDLRWQILPLGPFLSLTQVTHTTLVVECPEYTPVRLMMLLAGDDLPGVFLLAPLSFALFTFARRLP